MLFNGYHKIPWSLVTEMNRPLSDTGIGSVISTFPVSRCEPSFTESSNTELKIGWSQKRFEIILKFHDSQSNNLICLFICPTYTCK